MDVEKRLHADAASFANGSASLDVDGFISRTLAALGIPPGGISDTGPENGTGSPRADRTQRPAPAGGSHRSHREDRPA